MSEIVIRRAAAADVPAVVSISSDKEVARNTLSGLFPSPEKWQKRVDSDSAEEIWLVAELERQVVGVMDIHSHASRRRSHAATFGMAVGRNHWRKGVGVALLNSLTDLADNWMNISRLELFVFAKNEPAISLYKRFGFIEEGRWRKAAFRDGQLEDVLCMARLLDA